MKSRYLTISCMILILSAILLSSVSCTKLIPLKEKEKAETPVPEQTDTQTTEPESSDINTAYLDIINEYQDKYGKLFISRDIGGTEFYNNLSGLCYADLIDFDGDDVNELLLCYDTDPAVDGDYQTDGGLRYAVFGEKDGEAVMLGADTVKIVGNGGIAHQVTLVIKDGCCYFEEFEFGSDNIYLEKIILKSISQKEYTTVTSYGMGPCDYELAYTNPEYYIDDSRCTEEEYSEYSSGFMPYISISFHDDEYSNSYDLNKKSIEETIEELSK